MTSPTTPTTDLAVSYTGDPDRQVMLARSRVATTTQRHGRGRATAEQITEAKQALCEALLARHIRQVADAAPPLTAEQRDRLATLLRGGAK